MTKERNAGRGSRDAGSAEEKPLVLRNQLIVEPEAQPGYMLNRLEYDLLVEGELREVEQRRWGDRTFSVALTAGFAAGAFFATGGIVLGAVSATIAGVTAVAAYLLGRKNVGPPAAREKLKAKIESKLPDQLAGTARLVGERQLETRPIDARQLTDGEKNE